MKDRKPNKFLIIGMLLCSTTLCLNRFFYLPDFVEGLGLGIGIGLEFFGLFTLNHELKLRTWKKNLFKKIIHTLKVN